MTSRALDTVRLAARTVQYPLDPGGQGLPGLCCGAGIPLLALRGEPEPKPCGQRLWCVAAGKELPAMTVIAGLQTAATAMLRAMEYGYRNVTVRKEA